jgi:DNA invertase Pin-like site-specific DNA recombinase
MRIDFLSGLQLPSQRKARGSAHGKAKLNEVAVRKIRSMALNCKGGTSAKVLANVFGVSTSHVYAILAGDKWEWLDDERT